VNTIANQQQTGTPLVATSTPRNRAAAATPEAEAKAESRNSEGFTVFFMAKTPHPTRDCPETKATKDRIAKNQPAENQRVIAHTYHPQQYHQRQFHNEQYHPYQQNHMYQQHQEIQGLPPPPPVPIQEDFTDQLFRGTIHMITVDRAQTLTQNGRRKTTTEESIM
jgi:ATP-dependent exoDNAse (exonuclease V) beta subunit